MESGENAKSGENATALSEWRAHWPLTLAAMVGFSTMGLQSYGIGPFVPHLEKAFGWNRTDVMMGVSISNAVGIFMNLAVGLIIDRFGPRRVALSGLFIKTAAFALLGTATGTLLNWSLLWLVLAAGLLTVQSTVWTAAVAAKFDRSRGMAMAVALSGTPLTAMILPPLAVWLIGEYGWRHAFMGIGAIWLAFTLPVVFLFFHDSWSKSPLPFRGGAGGGGYPDSAGLGEGPHPNPSPEGEGHRAAPPGLTFREGIGTPAFTRLFISYGCFSFYSMTIATNIVPLLAETGISQMEAAGIASLMGIVGIIARLSVGFLLDRFPGNVIGTVTQLGPVVGCLLLLYGPPGALTLSIATLFFGAALGAEIDVAIYLATRHFGLKSFAALFGAIIGCGAVAATAGPYVAGRLHDTFGNYDALLWVMIVILTVGALTMATMKRPMRDWGIGGH